LNVLREFARELAVEYFSRFFARESFDHYSE